MILSGIPFKWYFCNFPCWESIYRKKLVSGKNKTLSRWSESNYICVIYQNIIQFQLTFYLFRARKYRNESKFACVWQNQLSRFELVETFGAKRTALIIAKNMKWNCIYKLIASVIRTFLQSAIFYHIFIHILCIIQCLTVEYWSLFFCSLRFVFFGMKQQQNMQNSKSDYTFFSSLSFSLCLNFDKETFNVNKCLILISLLVQSIHELIKIELKMISDADSEFSAF